MPTSETPTSMNKPESPTEASPEDGRPGQESPLSGRPEAERVSPVVLNSRWVDYDTHELLSMISELEDERRWARLREGALWAVLVHLALIVALAMLPRYIFMPKVVEPKVSDLHNKDEWTYMDTPRLPRTPPAPKPSLATPKPPVIDQKTLEDIRKQSPPAPAPPPPAPAEQAKPQIANPIPPAPQSQSQVEAPRPAAVPARPNFAFGSTNPANQLRDAMRGASRNNGAGNGALPPGGGLLRHPGAGGGVEVLSDTQGVDFRSWLQRWHHRDRKYLGPADSRRGQSAHPEVR